MSFCGHSYVDLVFGFDSGRYEVREESGLASPAISMVNGNPGNFTVRLTVATDDTSATTAIGTYNNYMYVSITSSSVSTKLFRSWIGLCVSY